MIDGVHMDRKVLDDCRESVNDDGVIDLDEARRIVADVLDGPRRVQRRGVESAVTDVELDTLRYAHEHFRWTEEADEWVYGELMAQFEGDTPAKTKMKKKKKKKKKEEEEEEEEEAGRAKAKNAEEDEDEDEDGEAENDNREEEAGDDDEPGEFPVPRDEAEPNDSDDDEEEEDDDDEDDDASDSDSESESESASESESISASPNPSPRRPDWDSMDDDITALAFARSVEVSVFEARLRAAAAAGTLFPSEAARRRHDATMRRATARFVARDVELQLEELRGGVSSSDGGTRSSQKDSLFGGHVAGGDLVEALPEANASRGAAMAALPSESARRKKPSERRKLSARDPAAQGGAMSARKLAGEGAGLFVAPLDASKLKREAKKLGAKSAGKSWFDMPAVEYTPELRRDMRLLKLRGAYDPKRFYKTDDTSKLPKHFQVGTVVEGAQDFYSARLSKRERKRTLTEEVFADAEIKAVRKKRFAKIQAAHAHTMGRKNKRKLGGRNRGGGGGVKSTKRVKH